jgi:Tfp pilus assembly protein FimT
MKNEEGITLVELIIVISVIAILTVALGFQFQGWMGRYNVESQTKQLYVDLMNARAKAMQQNRMHCVVLNATKYEIKDDKEPAPDGDGDCLDAGDEVVQQQDMDVRSTISISSGIPKTIRFSKQGIALPSDTGIVRINSSSDPDFDCINILQTRLILGKWKGTTCEAR